MTNGVYVCQAHGDRVLAARVSEQVDGAVVHPGRVTCSVCGNELELKPLPPEPPKED